MGLEKILNKVKDVARKVNMASKRQDVSQYIYYAEQNGANIGDVRLMTEYIDLAKFAARDIGMDISDQVSRLEDLGNTNNIKFNLEDAKTYAIKRRWRIMEHHIVEAKVTATLTNKDISKQLAEIEDFYEKTKITNNSEKNFKSLINRVVDKCYSINDFLIVGSSVNRYHTERLLFNAEFYKRHNQSKRSEVYVAIAEEYAKKNGKDISKRVSEITALEPDYISLVDCMDESSPLYKGCINLSRYIKNAIYQKGGKQNELS